MRSLPKPSAAVKQSLSVSTAVGAYALSFGALAVAAGLDLWQTMALSLLMFTGGSQFAFVGIIGAGGGASAAIATAGFLGVRNGFYGVTLAPLLRPMPWGRRLVAAQLTIDESTAVSFAQPADDVAGRKQGFWWTGAGVYVLWNIVTVAGAMLGQRIGDPAQWGLDAAAAAAFLGLLWPRLASKRAQLAALAAALVALAATPYLPAGVPILLAALVAIGAGIRTPADAATSDPELAEPHVSDASAAEHLEAAHPEPPGPDAGRGDDA